MRSASGSALLVLAALAACGGEPPDEPPGEAPRAVEAGPDLRPRLDELRAVASALPAPPAEEKRAELAELVESAFSSRSSEKLRASALAWLLDDERARYGLEQGLRHGEAGVRSSCAYRLGQLGERGAIPALLWRERQELEAEPLAWVVGALAVLGNRSALPRLDGLLADPATQHAATPAADWVLAAAGRALEERTWEALRGALAELHAEWSGRREAAVAAGEVDEELRPHVARLLVGLDGFQLRYVDEARTVITRLSVVPTHLLRLALTAEETYLRVHAVEIVRDLGRLGAGLGDSLLPLLDDPSSRPYAMEALGAVGHGPGYAPLAAALARADLDERVSAATALGALGDARALEPLRAVLADETESLDLRVHAAASLARLEDGGAGLAFLEERLAAGDYHAPTVRELLELARGPAAAAAGG